MDCERCARTITKRKPFLIVSLGRKHRFGYSPRGPELAFCSRACAAKALIMAVPVFLDRVPEGAGLPKLTGRSPL